MKDTRVKSDQKQNSATMLMTEGKIWKQLLVFAVPLILGNLLQQMLQRSGLHYCRQLCRQQCAGRRCSSNALINLLIALPKGRPWALAW